MPQGPVPAAGYARWSDKKRGAPAQSNRVETAAVVVHYCSLQPDTVT